MYRHTHTHIHTYIYMCVCVCVCVCVYKLFKLDEQDMRNTAREGRKNS